MTSQSFEAELQGIQIGLEEEAFGGSYFEFARSWQMGTRSCPTCKIVLGTTDELMHEHWLLDEAHKRCAA